MFCGVTTVCHHNPYEEEVFGGDFPVRILKRYGWAHSLEFEKNLPEAFARTPSDAPFIIHLGEGTDRRSQDEIFVLDSLGALTSRTVVVHGVGITPEGHALRRRRSAALLWCPTSNLFVLGSTLDVRSIGPGEQIALGSDSALTAQGDLLDEIAEASRVGGVDAAWIYSMVTEAAANILRLRDGEGTIRTGSVADLIAVKWGDSTPAETLVGADLKKIELVMVSGKPHLVSPEMSRRWPQGLLETNLEGVEVEGTPRLVRAPIRWMLSQTRQSLSENFLLAGKRVTA